LFQIASASTTDVTWAARNGPWSKLNAKSSATLGPARSQHAPTAFCFHSGAESVGTLAFDYTGLKSAFHRDPFFMAAKVSAAKGRQTYCFR